MHIPKYVELQNLNHSWSQVFQIWVIQPLIPQFEQEQGWLRTRKPANQRYSAQRRKQKVYTVQSSVCCCFGLDLEGPSSKAQSRSFDPRCSCGQRSGATGSWGCWPHHCWALIEPLRGRTYLGKKNRSLEQRVCFVSSIYLSFFAPSGIGCMFCHKSPHLGMLTTELSYSSSFPCDHGNTACRVLS